jgi:hypothetical protein
MNFIKPFACDKEAQVVEAARTGSWDAELRLHADTCPACSEVALAARVLNEMHAADLAEARIPDAGLMWWKAQLLAKREAAERASQPINFVERFAYAWVAVGVIGVCIWQWSAIRAWFESFAAGRSGFASASNATSAVISAFSSVAGWVDKATHFHGLALVSVLSAGGLLVLVCFALFFAQSEE